MKSQISLIYIQEILIFWTKFGFEMNSLTETVEQAVQGRTSDTHPPGGGGHFNFVCTGVCVATGSEN